MKIIFVIIAIVVLSISAWITYRLADSTEDTTVRRVQAQINSIADIPNESPEAMRLLSEKKGTSIADALVDAGFIRPDGLIDSWGEKLVVKCANEKCTQIIVQSNGPNRQNDNGKGDDIVSISSLH
jgi:hypothetical protein